MTQTKTRPKDFDARLLSHRPMMERMARRLVPAEDREDLVQSAFTRAMEKWDDCRDGFVAWLRGIVLAEYSIYRRRHTLSPVNDNVQPATQMQVVEASQALGQCRYPRIMMQVGQGATSADIAVELGISRQAVHQKILKDRARLVACA